MSKFTPEQLYTVSKDIILRLMMVRVVFVNYFNYIVSSDEEKEMYLLI